MSEQAAASELEAKRARLRALKRKVRWNRRWVVLLLLVEAALLIGFLIVRQEAPFGALLHAAAVYSVVM